RGPRPRGGRRGTSRPRRPVPPRDTHRRRRTPGTPGGPVRQPGRAVRAARRLPRAGGPGGQGAARSRPQYRRKRGSPMTTVSVRYIVSDIDAAIDFYTSRLRFELQMRPNDLFAMLAHGDLRLVLVRPVGPDGPAGGGAPMPDGAMQEP